jgi:hypothetical protein
MTITAVEYRVTTTDGTIEYSGYVDGDGTLRIHPLQGPRGVDFVGNEFFWDELPPPDHLPEGTVCTVCIPGGSGWYTSCYEVRGREWVRVSTTIPWQLEV